MNSSATRAFHRQATGDAKTPGLMMMGAAIVNIVLDPLFIFGLAGFPRLGLTGAAVATVIGRALNCVFTLGILHFREHLLECSRPRLGDVLDSWKDIAQVGIPAAVVNCMSPIFLGIVMRLAAGFGEHVVAAFGACFRVSGFALIPVFATGAAMLPFVGQNWGAREFGRVRHARSSGYRFCLSWGMACVLLFMVAAPSIARLFSQDAEVRSITVLYLMIVPLGFGLQGMIIAATSIMNAINRPLVGAALIFTQFFLMCFRGSQTVFLLGCRCRQRHSRARRSCFLPSFAVFSIWITKMPS